MPPFMISSFIQVSDSANCRHLYGNKVPGHQRKIPQRRYSEKTMERKNSSIVIAGMVLTGETPDTVGEDSCAGHPRLYNYCKIERKNATALTVTPWICRRVLRDSNSHVFLHH